MAPGKGFIGIFLQGAVPSPSTSGSEKKEAGFSSSEDNCGFARFPFPSSTALKTGEIPCIYVFIPPGKEERTSPVSESRENKIMYRYPRSAQLCSAAQVVPHYLISNTWRVFKAVFYPFLEMRHFLLKKVEIQGWTPLCRWPRVDSQRCWGSPYPATVKKLVWLVDIQDKLSKRGISSPKGGRWRLPGKYWCVCGQTPREHVRAHPAGLQVERRFSRPGKSHPR